MLTLRRCVVVAVLRAVVRRDAQRFGEALAALHPGERGRVVAVILVSR